MMNSKGEAFEMGDFKWQARMMDALIMALEQSLIGFM
jgi:alkyl sulfatase BDS1-like metallo-beta-lactamase superfamily hydrolase